MSLVDLKKYLAMMIENFSTVIDLEMTILNIDPFQRLAWTGDYYNARPSVLNEQGRLRDSWKDSYTFKVIKTKKSIVAIDTQEYAKKSDRLNQYENKKYYSVICAPILIEGIVEGVIVIASTNAKQQKILIQKQKQLLRYLENLSDLIASKAKESRLLMNTMAIKNELTSVVDTIQEGIILYSCVDGVLHINPYAKLYLHFSDEKIYGALLNEVIRLSDSSIKKRKSGIEQIYKNIDGIQFSLQVQTYPVSNDSHKILCIINPFSKIQNDISQNDSEGNDVERAIAYSSHKMHEVLKTTEIIASSPVSVLITGESGTGKELFARVIHAHSDRKENPFVAVNCASIPESLLESELFGYENGAFTGARKGGKIGKFLLANHGTLFLDEIGELPLYMQAKLLRVLSERQIDPIGSTRPIEIDVRIIAATNRNIEKMIADKQFREDLYYRLNVIPLYLPPLRERKEDIFILIKFFMEKYNKILGKTITSISNDALKILRQYDWPGNVRELENCIEYMMTFETGTILSSKHLPKTVNVNKRYGVMDEIMNGMDFHQPLKKTVRTVEQHIILKLVENYGGQPSKEEVMEICKALNISVASYYRKLKGEG